MDFEPEFEADENDVEFVGEHESQETFDGTGGVASASAGADAAASDDAELAFDEAFRAVEESGIASDAEANATHTTVDAANSETSHDRADRSTWPSNEGPYINAATIPDITITSPSLDGGMVELESHNPGADSHTGPSSASSSDRVSDESSARTRRMFRPNFERGQPPVCPIVLVRVADEQMEQLVSETRKRFAHELAVSSQEVARQEVHQEFWRRDCELRAIVGH
jgi:hypothetical protein